MKTVLMILAMSAVLLVGACSKGGSDPLASGASPLSGQNLANETVTQSTSLVLYMAILNQLFDSYSKGLNAVAVYDRPSEAVNFLGNSTGRASATIGIPKDTASTPEETASMSEDSTTVPVDIYYDIGDTTSTIVPNLTINFTNFSNTGKLFFTGTFTFEAYWKVSSQATYLDSLIIEGSADFAGDFAGSIVFDNAHVGLDGNGHLVDLSERANDSEGDFPYIGLYNIFGMVTIYSGEQRINLYPQLPDN